MRVLILGATGLLGRVLLEEWGTASAVGVSSRDGDIRDREQVQRLFLRYRPESAVLCSAFTDVDGCEKDPERAHQVNCDGAANVAEAARNSGSRLAFLSTDYVFDGAKNQPYEPEDPVCPLSIYGRSKADGERRVREILPNCCIVRTSWLFGANRRCFPSVILELAEKQARLQVVDDQEGSPSFNRDVARAIIRLVEANAEGILHVNNAGSCSRYEFARELIRIAGFADVKLDAVSTQQSPRPARRPHYSVLSGKCLQPYGISMRPWQQTLGAYFEERAKNLVIG